jgi:hypothetical protein
MTTMRDLVSMTPAAATATATAWAEVRQQTMRREPVESMLLSCKGEEGK